MLNSVLANAVTKLILSPRANLCVCVYVCVEKRQVDVKQFCDD